MIIRNMKLGWICVDSLTISKKFFTETLGLEFFAEDSSEQYGWMELIAQDRKFILGVVVCIK